MEQLFRINADGSLEAIYSDKLLTLAGQGLASVSRASHVEPFIGFVDTDGAEGIKWEADMSPLCNIAGLKWEVLGPFNSREEALAAEVNWINKHYLGDTDLKNNL